YLQVARQVARCAVLDEAYEWLKSLEIAGRAIPASMHAAALEPWNMERMGQASWTITAIEQLLEGFLQHVKFRKLLHEEIAKGS
ncbi:MAG TPA: hypothetical protein PKD72_03495, partial [Gemmatales bacterium]|nr:hypothetical protein [Gemmatales bacterium]